jgi:hypothetical protein
MNNLLLDIIKNKEYKIGAEIGVRFGTTSKRILELPSIEKLYGVDIRYDDDAGRLNQDSRFHYIIKDSLEASKDFEDNFFDFVYIDAGHSYTDVCNDLLHWSCKVKPNGLFCGDDYVICHNPAEGHYGVVDAIENFSQTFGIQIEIAGFEGISKDERLELAQKIGKANEDNLYLAHCYMLPPEACNGRVRSENLPILNWYYFK